MRATTRRRPTSEFMVRLASEPAPGSFHEGELAGLPDTVRRYLSGSIAPGTALARAARLRMRGAVKLGRTWVPFRARQLSAPHEGLLWMARAGGIVVGSDRYADGEGSMEWKLLGLVTLIRAHGPDVARSAAGRAGAEAVWVPTALLPRFGVTWQASDTHHATARYRLDDDDLDLDFVFDDDARVRSVSLDRWSDPDGTGRFGFYRFGHELTDYSTYGGVTVPCAGRGGWFHGTDRWSAGVFFRYRFTEFHLVSSPSRGRT